VALGRVDSETVTSGKDKEKRRRKLRAKDAIGLTFEKDLKTAFLLVAPFKRVAIFRGWCQGRFRG